MTGNLATLIKKRGPIRRIGVTGMGCVGIPAAALFPAGLSFVRLQDRDAEPRGVPAQG